ncbi:hypothetical protein HYPSUDRAFT_583308 [Hypholoma sublateritium FD-334 SS-4]|uniref:Uncharacterized protein n=1 Tax=Hypholoma sublateritium (strain FD-334 SS-4) TaxID=945553 RepID=A0A0D2MIW0_HYPSF|nr:hypothetical protein HYPSUDRAFT_583308 [Hypholoma sublateritium FD-334 SS-4]
MQRTTTDKWAPPTMDRERGRWGRPCGMRLVPLPPALMLRMCPSHCAALGAWVREKPEAMVARQRRIPDKMFNKTMPTQGEQDISGQPLSPGLVLRRSSACVRPPAQSPSNLTEGPVPPASALLQLYVQAHDAGKSAISVLYLTPHPNGPQCIGNGPVPFRRQARVLLLFNIRTFVRGIFKTFPELYSSSRGHSQGLPGTSCGGPLKCKNLREIQSKHDRNVYALCRLHHMAHHSNPCRN